MLEFLQRRKTYMHYKILCKIDKENVDPDILGINNLEYLHRFHEANNNLISFYIYSIKENDLTIVAVSNHMFDKTQSIEKAFNIYSSYLPIVFSKYDIQMITYEDYDGLVDNLVNFMAPEHEGITYFIQEDELEKHMIPHELGRFEPKEQFVGKNSYPILPELQSSYNIELERIKSSTSQTFLGHPIHYHIHSKNVDDAELVAKSLITELIDHKRLLSNKLVKIKVHPLRRTDRDLSITLAQHMASGGSILFNLSNNMDVHCIKAIEAEIPKLCTSINNAQHEVLYFFYTNEVTDFYEKMKEYLQIKALDIKPERLDFFQSKDYLINRFKQSNLNETRIYELINAKESYTLSQLELIVDQEVQSKQVLSYFPLYEDFYERKLNIIQPQEENRQDGLSKLNELIGLGNVKQKVLDMINANNNRKLLSTHLNISSFSNHMVFTGNPGTAKTTVARILGQVFKENHMLSVGDYFEVSRKDIIDKYVGWTSRNIHELFEKAKGSVLFIDEAYSILDPGYKGFGDEAISTIIQEMENNREDLVVIFAGYPEKMDSFINSNPGLKSRIQHHIHFNDYSVFELLKITNYMLGKHNFTITQDAKHLLTQHFINIKNNKYFGNAREVRNIIEQAITTQLSKLAIDKDSSLNPEYLILKSEDFIFLDENKNQSIRLIN